jgi:hypothetical protein
MSPQRKLVEAWLTFQRNWWAYEALDRLCAAHPEEAWPLVLALINAADTDELLDSIGAGPLEDLIDKHGDRMIDRIEAAARDNPHLRLALKSVLLRDEASEVARRFVALGCEGVPISNGSDV